MRNWSTGDLLGLPYLPAHANPNLNFSKLLAGVNYASAAGGILDVTGTFLVINSTNNAKSKHIISLPHKKLTNSLLFKNKEVLQFG